MIPLRDGIRWCTRVQRLGHRAVIRHGAGCDLAVRRDEHLAGQCIRRARRNGGHILIRIGDLRNGDVGQTVIAAVRGDRLLCFRGRDRLALQLVVAAARHTGNRTAAVVVACGNGVGIALLHSRGDRALIGNAIHRCGAIVQLGRRGHKPQCHQLCTDLVSRRLELGEFCCNAHKTSYIVPSSTSMLPSSA